MEELIAEAKTLAEDGVKELIVVAQDTSRYGEDLYGARKLPELLRELCKIDGFHWIRVHYLYPEAISEELIDVFATEPKLVKYFDIPFQHINDEILKKMNRHTDGAYIRKLVTHLRERVPGAVFRTSLITGLPGEGEAEFEELCEFLREFRLERAGAFVFSPEEGTAAAKMDYPPREDAERRAEVLTELQAGVMEEFSESLVGETLEVLCEGFDEETGLWYGRSYADSPDIDGRVFFTSETRRTPGEFVRVFIGDTEDGDPVGAAVTEE